MSWLLLVLACSNTDSTEPGATCALEAPDPGALRAVGAELRDQHDRVVLLRGVNAGGRSKFAPYMPLDWDQAGGTAAFDQALGAYLDRAQGWGLDVLRVPFSWAAEEPAPGQVDEAWVERYAALLDGAWARGMWTIVDFHQDVYSEAYCGDGFPLWTLPDYDPENPPATRHDCPDWFLGYLGDDQVEAAFDRFWADEDGVQTAWRAMWQRTVARHADRGGVIGYELINEPGQGSQDDATFFGQTLPAFYEEVAAELQAADPGALVFFDSTGLDAVRATTELVPPEGSNLVFAPHFYDPSIFLGGEADPDFVAEGLASWATYAEAWDLPVLVGELGIQHDRPGADRTTRAHYEALDANALHATWWEYSQSSEDWNAEGLSVVAADGTEHDEILDELVRPYPRALAGGAAAWTWDGELFEAEWQATAGGISELVLPARRFGDELEIVVEGACWDRQADRLLVRSESGGPVRLQVSAL